MVGSENVCGSNLITCMLIRCSFGIAHSTAVGIAVEQPLSMTWPGVHSNFVCDLASHISSLCIAIGYPVE